MIRKVILYIATSLDWYIARQDGGVDWLDDYQSDVDYGWKAFIESVDTVLMGYGTYVKSLEFGEQAFLPGLDYIVFSRSHPQQRHPGVTFTSEQPIRVISKLQERPGKHIWLMGGGILIRSFREDNLIDVYRIFVMPSLLGEGIPLFLPAGSSHLLKLQESRAYTNGVVELVYGRKDR